MHLLPQILAEITRKPRQRVVEGVDFEWSDKSLTHNFFRLLEVIFWRQSGIRPEFSSFVDERGKSYVYVHSFESAVAYTETYVRSFLGSFKLVPIEIYIPQLIPAGFPVRVTTPYLFAIAYDNSATTSFGASPRTVSLTCTGSNLILGMHSATLNDTSTAPTYNSVSSTTASIASTFIGSGRLGVRGYYLVNPATGANTASFGTSAGSIQGFVASYSGANQTGQPDSTGSTSTGAVTPITLSVTTTADQCWVSMCEIDSGAGSSPSHTAGSNVNAIRVSDVTISGCIADGGPSATGATSYDINLNGSVTPVLSCVIGIAFAPAPGTATVTPTLLLMGVG